MSEVQDSQSVEAFVAYDNTLREKIDDASKQLLDKISERFGGVEVSDLAKEGGSWCVRISATNNEGEPLPLAAIGGSLEQAAERLWRVSTFF